MGLGLVNPAVQNYDSQYRASKDFTFDGTAGKGAVGTACAIFTLTNDLLIRAIFATLRTTVVGGAGSTLELGVTGATTQFNAATLTSTMDGVSGYAWQGGEMVSFGALPAAMKDYRLAGKSAEVMQIIMTPRITDTTEGVLAFTVIYTAADGANLPVLA